MTDDRNPHGDPNQGNPYQVIRPERPPARRGTAAVRLARSVEPRSRRLPPDDAAGRRRLPGLPAAAGYQAGYRPTEQIPTVGATGTLPTTGGDAVHRAPAGGPDGSRGGRSRAGARERRHRWRRGIARLVEHGSSAPSRTRSTHRSPAPVPRPTRRRGPSRPSPPRSCRASCRSRSRAPAVKARAPV